MLWFVVINTVVLVPSGLPGRRPVAASWVELAVSGVVSVLTAFSGILSVLMAFTDVSCFLFMLKF
jgi:hypothetical protein